MIVSLKLLKYSLTAAQMLFVRVPICPNAT